MFVDKTNSQVPNNICLDNRALCSELLALWETGSMPCTNVTVAAVVFKTLCKSYTYTHCKYSFRHSQNSTLPVPLYCWGTTFKNKFWKGGSEKREWLGEGLKEFLPQIFAWGVIMSLVKKDFVKEKKDFVK